MGFTGWIPKATNTRTEYVILIVSPRQQWSGERASMLCAYIACLVLVGLAGKCSLNF